MFDAVKALIGEIPYGFEPVVYVLCIPFTMWLVGQVLGIFVSMFRGWADAL